MANQTVHARNHITMIRLKSLVICAIWTVINYKLVYCENVIIPELGTMKGTTTKISGSERVIFQFFGIPFAEPPIGLLRFKAR